MTVQHATQVAQKQVMSSTFKGNDRLLLGIVLSVITFWLFAQTTLNISAAIYTGLSSDVVALSNAFMVGRTDNISVRFAAMVDMLFNLIMVLIAIISILAPFHPARKRMSPDPLQ